MKELPYSRKLTNREHRVLNLAWDGRTHREIADQLCISVRTVGNHVARIYDKLGVTSLVGAVRAGIEIGIIELPERHQHTVVHYCTECDQAVENVLITHVVPAE